MIRLLLVFYAGALLGLLTGALMATASAADEEWPPRGPDDPSSQFGMKADLHRRSESSPTRDQRGSPCADSDPRWLTSTEEGSGVAGPRDHRTA